MNAERLHAIARAIRDDLDSTEELSLVEQLAGAMRNQVNQPGSPDYPQQTTQFRDTLFERLSAAPSNDFSAAWRETLDELRISEELTVADLLGERLRSRIEEIFLRNEITQPVAADELQVITEQVQRLRTNLDQLITGLETFHIGAEELAPGEFEIGFLIPRDAVDNELEELAEELIEVKKEIFGPIQELATGGREDVTVSMISSSEFQFFLQAAPDVAAMLSQIIVDLYEAYARVKGIRAKIDALRNEDDVPEEVLDSLVTHANGLMNESIAEIATTLITEHAENVRAAGRTPDEMTATVTHTLKQTTKRIENRWLFEVRIPEEEPEPEDGEESAALADDVQRARRIIEENQPKMRRLELVGDPILELEDGNDGDGDNDNGA